MRGVVGVVIFNSCWEGASRHSASATEPSAKKMYHRFGMTCECLDFRADARRRRRGRRLEFVLRFDGCRASRARLGARAVKDA